MRQRQRGARDKQKLQDAVAAIVGGLLHHWARTPPCPAFHSRKANAFSAGGLVSVRQFVPVIDALVARGFVATAAGVRWAYDWGDGTTSSQGLAARFWPNRSLIEAAERHGLRPATVATDFEETFRTKAPKVVAPIEVRSLRAFGRTERRSYSPAMLGPDADRIAQDVEQVNAFAAEFDIRGCTPPRWKRVYVVSPLLGGRWTALGTDGVYQTMSAARRLGGITINGEPVVEVDVKASHLSIMHGLLGLPLPDGDQYGLPELPRAVVKAWITATLGKGSAVTKWPQRTREEAPDIARYCPIDVGQRICARYPFLARPAQAVAGPARLDRLEHLGSPEKLLTHRLMAIEAEALTGAMSYLRNSRGVLALPIHDSLLVPRSGLGYVRGGLEGAFGYFAKVRVRVTQEAIVDGALVSGPL
jgi:hypothetical protein